MNMGKTKPAPNKIVYAAALKRLGLRSPRSFHSHGSLQHIGGGGLATQALLCRRQRHIQQDVKRKFFWREWAHR
jgi:hypothetical protein